MLDFFFYQAPIIPTQGHTNHVLQQCAPRTASSVFYIPPSTGYEQATAPMPVDAGVLMGYPYQHHAGRGLANIAADRVPYELHHNGHYGPIYEGGQSVHPGYGFDQIIGPSGFAGNMVQGGNMNSTIKTSLARPALI